MYCTQFLILLLHSTAHQFNMIFTSLHYTTLNTLHGTPRFTPSLRYTSLYFTSPHFTTIIYLKPVSENYLAYNVSSGSGSSVGIATGYGLDGPRIEFHWGLRFFAHVQTGPGAHPASCTMGTGSFPGVKRSGRCADHPPPPSAEVRRE
jgi:hypothetical protein